MTFVLGITGGIASGKTTVVRFFKKEGFPVVDGDIIARKVVEPETDGLKALEKNFGPTILQSNGKLDRKKLGSIIFSDEKKRQLVDETLDPFIRGEISRQIQEAKKSNDLVIVDIPLLYERHYEMLMDKVAVVYVSPAIQLKRLMARNELSEKEALMRINSQLSLEEKKKRADILFDNCDSIETTHKQVLDWLKENKFVS
ncbi:dephospho-CoA kinase [Enterococcus dongliensis]|uniref:Dephospho-CoA kinase n=1 Tax=Enterococcus dongliensis TaxID=2559925 RepID=A0AAP5NKF0_9ENTE|nr:dephospho-CoA kinase [Enterococcus dongliensis]MDT2595883.1 dephospho-CoA kinase [Enterococcus dongliensis]MDT2602856.1 dephospho-CoA kinase [Enterococcus dongliensis]MDT2633950.1 dephospho-CoA kinase [Enterococcus dongliensis]MDT2637288.1 dephospho-CoA kinase [Enterococcus dongliensis]MDT2639628.1 dephospho-CoA kinase [Enterococcus dongliensis]